MPLTTYYAAHRMIGDPDGRALPREGELYLLDGALRIIGGVTCGGEVQIGTPFFAQYPAEQSEREALERQLCEYARRSLLLLCGDTPALAIGALFLQTGLLPVVLPNGSVQQALRRPALFDGVPESLRVSRGGLARYAEPTGEQLEALGRWYRSVSHPFFYGADATDGEAMLRVMSSRATHLVRLCGCRLEFDLTGLGMRPGDVFDLELYTGVLLAAMMATHRIGRERTLRMFARREYGLGPVMYLELHRTDVRDTLPELLPLVQMAQARGAILDCVCLPEDPERVEIRASISPVELSFQGVKEQNPLTGGQSVLDLVPSEIRFENEK